MSIFERVRHLPFGEGISVKAIDRRDGVPADRGASMGRQMRVVCRAKSRPWKFLILGEDEDGKTDDLMRELCGAKVEIGLATMAYNLKRMTNVLGVAKLREALHLA